MASRNLTPFGFGGFGRGFPFGELQSQMNRLFDDFWKDGNLPQEASFAGLAPSIDVQEDDKAYHISAELPGVDEKEIELSVADGVLTLKGEKKFEDERKDKNTHVTERRYGSFSRSFRLPAEVDVEKIAARFEKGVLSVEVPKKAEAQQASRRIAIGK